MPANKRTPTVVLLNSNEDILNALRDLFEEEGYIVTTGHVVHLRNGKLDFRDLMARYDPDLILYDIAPPYDDNWTFFNLLRTTEPARGRKFFITTTNKAAFESLVGPTYAEEIIGKPFDLEELVRKAKAALNQPEPQPLTPAEGPDPRGEPH